VPVVLEAAHRPDTSVKCRALVDGFRHISEETGQLVEMEASTS